MPDEKDMTMSEGDKALALRLLSPAQGKLPEVWHAPDPDAAAIYSDGLFGFAYGPTGQTITLTFTADRAAHIPGKNMVIRKEVLCLTLPVAAAVAAASELFNFLQNSGAVPKKEDAQ